MSTSFHYTRRDEVIFEILDEAAYVKFGLRKYVDIGKKIM